MTSSKRHAMPYVEKADTGKVKIPNFKTERTQNISFVLDPWMVVCC